MTKETECLIERKNAEIIYNYGYPIKSEDLEKEIRKGDFIKIIGEDKKYFKVIRIIKKEFIKAHSLEEFKKIMSMNNGGNLNRTISYYETELSGVHYYRGFTYETNDKVIEFKQEIDEKDMSKDEKNDLKNLNSKK